MHTVYTKYGELKGISFAEWYKTGEVKECILNGRCEIATPYGVLVPRFEDDGVRKKYGKSVSFYENGCLKSISLQEQTTVKTPIGEFPAELVTFYASGSIKRVFPLNGKISGCWTEENEYELAQEFEFCFPFGSFRKKVIGIQFYESGKVKSLTLWPKDYVTIKSPIGEVKVRTGISMYSDGRIKSFEPHQPIEVNTPVGVVTAYNPAVIGIHGDANSLSFYEDGEVKSLMTSTNKIIVSDRQGRKVIYRPTLKPHLLDQDLIEIHPLGIEFFNGKIRINYRDEDTYEIDQYDFQVKKLPLEMHHRTCEGCSGCNACH